MSRKGSIIVIEDDLDDQQILKDIFTDLNVKKELLFFQEANAAFNYLMSMKEKPFLIICDINLPKMNGIELKRKIDNTDYLKYKAIPFVFLTTSNAQSNIDEAYRATKVQGYFGKSNTMADVKKSVQLILEYWTLALHPSDK